MRTTIENTLRDGYFPDIKTDINFIIDYFESLIKDDEYINSIDTDEIESEVILQMSKIIRKDILKGPFQGTEIQKRIHNYYMEDNKETFELMKKNHKEILKNNRLVK